MKRNETVPESREGIAVKGPEMNVDEMELVGRLGAVEPLPAAAFDQARAVLQAAIAVEGDPQLIELTAHPKRRRQAVVVRSALAAGLAAAMVAAALVVTVPGKSPNSAAANHVATLSGQSPRGTAGSNHVASPLIRLAAYVGGSATPTGNATLVARTTTGGGQSVTVYDLYADNGRYFFSQTESGLAGQVSAGHDFPGGATFAREIAAAKLAATGDVAAAAQDMADAPDPSNVVSPTDTADAATLEAKHVAPGSVGNLFDNWAWENSLDAIISGSGDPQVRAGVLRILATLPDVTVTPGTSGGQSTLVLTAGTAELDSTYTEQLTINATTGVPLSFAGGAPGQAPTGTISYQVSRVTTSDIADGKF